ncbi:MAG: ATP-binding protein [Sedimenticola sp.]
MPRPVIAENLFDAIEVGLIVVGPGCRLISWNLWFTVASGISDKPNVGRTLTDIFPEIENGRVIQSISEALEQGMSAIVSPRLQRDPFPLYASHADLKSNKMLRQMVVVRPFSEDYERRCLVQVMDVTAAVEREEQSRQLRHESEQANQRLKENQRQLETIIDNLPAVFFTKDSDGIYLMVNRRYEEAVGISKEDVIGKHDTELLPADIAEKLVQVDNRVLSSKSPTTVEESVPHPDGTLHIYLSTKAPMLDEQGNAYALLGMAADISQQKALQVELAKSKELAEMSNQAKSIFLANMSHELRTPLNAILGFSTMLGYDPSITKEQHEIIDIINRSGEHLLDMINDVLDISKIEAGRSEIEAITFDLPQLLNDVGKMFEVRAENAGLKFELSIQTGTNQYILTDAGKLRQILINLLGNAIKFTHKGKVSLRAATQPIENDPSRVSLQLEVEDSGVGIPDEQQKRIFEPFVQSMHNPSNTKGTGLGLSITQSFVTLFGGDIKLMSRTGEGTLFFVELPVTVADADDIDSAVAVLPAVLGLEPGQKAWRILVVEDNADNRLLLSSMLTQAGFDVKEAENGKEALNLFQQWLPHFIWMDMRMPVMDGYEATSKIRSQPDGDKVSIVALTASVFSEQREKVLSSGCDDIRYKPFQPYEIFDAIKQQLGVRYLYAEEPRFVYEEKRLVRLTVQMLETLPQNLKDILNDAALNLDITTTQSVIQQIRGIDTHIADGLQALLDRYQFSTILELLGK